MLVKIIPHGTSFTWETLTYSVGDSFDFDIKIWQLVKIPYGKKEIFGIISEILGNPLQDEENFENIENPENFSVQIPWKFAIFKENFSEKNEIVNEEIFENENFEKNFREDKKNKIENSENIFKEKFNIKSLISIENPKPILAPYQTKMIERISMKYMLPIHKSLSIFLSEPVLKRLQKYNFPLEKNSENFEKKISPPLNGKPEEFLENENSWENFSEKNFEKNPKNPTFDFYISKNEIISPEKLQKFFKKNLVIILPDDILLQRFENFFKNMNEAEKNKNFPFSIAFYPNDTTDTKRAQAFIDIYNKKSEIIIWSRRLIQYNLSAYDEIWYLEDSFSRDYYHYPTRIAYTDFLAHMVDSEDFSIKIFTSIPSLSTLSKFHFFNLHHF